MKNNVVVRNEEQNATHILSVFLDMHHKRNPMKEIYQPKLDLKSLDCLQWKYHYNEKVISLSVPMVEVK